MLKVIPPPPSTFVAQESTNPESPPLAGRAWRQSVGLQDVQFVAAKESAILGASIESKFKPINDLDAPPSPESDAESLADEVEKDTDLPGPVTLAASSKLQSPASGRASQPSSPSKVSKQHAHSFTDDTRSVAGPSKSPARELFPGTVPSTWPNGIVKVGSGLVNQGNTCFINSVLQCLFYTPPLLNMLVRHRHIQCQAAARGFCMNCSLGEVTLSAYRNERGYLTPFAVTKNLNHIAKHMRRGRQEDAHEFLRYLIDALQKAELTGLPPKPDPKIAETTWVHKVFGGRLRSRVTCYRCGHHSDTLESCLDLSLDLDKVNTVEQALASFVRPEKLFGENKYKCEKCKIPVNAEKQFTIHQAPQVLTIHLKRFSITGRKVTRFIEYPQSVDLQPYMSKDQFGSKYFLYGIISHAGGGPHSGHYYAHIKSSLGKWHEMNDEMVSSPLKPPMSLQSAYVLFYLRGPSAQLDQVIGHVKTPTSPQKRRIDPDTTEGLSSPPLKKNKSLSYPVLNLASSTGEDLGVPLDVPKVQRSATLPPSNPTAEMLQKKIQAHTLGVKLKASDATTATSPITVKAHTKLVDYPDEESDEEDKIDNKPPNKITNTDAPRPNSDFDASSAQSRPGRFIGPMLPPSRNDSSSTLMSTSDIPNKDPSRPSTPISSPPATPAPSTNPAPEVKAPKPAASRPQVSPTSFYDRPFNKDRQSSHPHDKHKSYHHAHKRHHPYRHDERDDGRRRDSREHDRNWGNRGGGRDRGGDYDKHYRDGRGRDYRSSRPANPFSGGGLGIDTLHHDKNSPGKKQGDRRHGPGHAKRLPLAKSMKRKVP